MHSSRDEKLLVYHASLHERRDRRMESRDSAAAHRDDHVDLLITGYLMLGMTESARA
jgi:hypothetical protein